MDDVYHDKFKDEDYVSGVPEPKNEGTPTFVFWIIMKLMLVFAVWFFWDEIKPYYHHFFPPEVEEVAEKSVTDITDEEKQNLVNQVLIERAKPYNFSESKHKEFNVEFECRTRDAVMLKLNIRSVDEISEHNRIMIESVTSRAVNDLNAEEIYNDIGLFNKNLVALLVEFGLIERVRNIEFTFSASFTQMMQQRKYAEEALTKAKYRVEIAKHEAEARRLQHEAEMEALAMKRERMLYETETANRIKELAK